VIGAEVSPEAKILFQTGDRLDSGRAPLLLTFAGERAAPCAGDGRRHGIEPEAYSS